MPSLDEQIDAGIARQLIDNWGGRLPTWDEFKQASREGRVSVNKGIASKTLSISATVGAAPRIYWVIYGIIVPWLMFLSIPVAIALYALVSFSGWWIPGAFLFAIFLYKVSLQGSCDGIKSGAELDERFYSFLATRGAFLFEPKKS